MADPLGLIFLSGDYRRVHFGLAMAAAALATNRPAVLFFTMEGCRALLRDHGWRDLAGDPPPAVQDSAFGRKGVGTFEDLMEGCGALGGRFLVCDMGLRAMDIDSAQLREDLPIEVAGLATLYGAIGASAPTVI